MKTVDVLIIGGGASGFFCGCELLLRNPSLRVAILEKSGKTLSKVRISGGGRCNVTHGVSQTKEWLNHYPRGAKYLRNKLNDFGLNETISWFSNVGVELKTEDDGRMFPVSNSSETIAGALEETFHQHGGQVLLKHEMQSIEALDSRYLVKDQWRNEWFANTVVLATGGLMPKFKQQLENQLSALQIIETAPSIFSLNIKSSLRELSGVSVSQARVRFTGDKEHYLGPLLITHWGLSGPSVLKSSAWKAFWLKAKGYQAEVLIGWVSEKNEDKVRTDFEEHLSKNELKQLENAAPFQLPSRLWHWILGQSHILTGKKCKDLTKSDKNKVVEMIMRTNLLVQGKTTYKDEFVTAGGLELESLELTGESKAYPGLYVIGELLNVDGVTGGFNFQAAWSTAYAAAKAIEKTLTSRPR